MFGKTVWSSDLRAPGRRRPRLVMKPDDFFSGCSSLWRAVGVGSAEARCALCLGRRGGQGLAPPRLLPLAVPSTPPGSLHHPIDPNTTPPRTHTFNPQGELSSAPFLNHYITSPVSNSSLFFLHNKKLCWLQISSGFSNTNRISEGTSFLCFSCQNSFPLRAGTRKTCIPPSVIFLFVFILRIVGKPVY